MQPSTELQFFYCSYVVLSSLNSSFVVLCFDQELFTSSTYHRRICAKPMLTLPTCHLPCRHTTGGGGAQRCGGVEGGRSGWAWDRPAMPPRRCVAPSRAAARAACLMDRKLCIFCSLHCCSPTKKCTQLLYCILRSCKRSQMYLTDELPKQDSQLFAY